METPFQREFQLHFLGKRQLFVTSSFKVTHPWLRQFKLFDDDNWKKVNSVQQKGANKIIYFLYSDIFIRKKKLLLRSSIFPYLFA